MADGLQSSADRIVARLPVGATTIAVSIVSVVIIHALAGGMAAATGWDVFAAGLTGTTLIAWFVDTRWFALAIPAAAGLGSLYAATIALSSDVPGVLGYTFLGIGSALLLCVAHSIRGSRVAWSFLCALCAVYPVTLLFGAPKIAKVVGTTLPIAMIPAGIVAGAVVALTMQKADFVTSPPVVPATTNQHARGRYLAGLGLVSIIAGLLFTGQDDLQILRCGVVLVAGGLLTLSRGFVELARPVA